jgi:hypothetical protein
MGYPASSLGKENQPGQHLWRTQNLLATDKRSLPLWLLRVMGREYQRLAIRPQITGF